jgi:hypothetical protein
VTVPQNGEHRSSTVFEVRLLPCGGCGKLWDDQYGCDHLKSQNLSSTPYSYFPLGHHNHNVFKPDVQYSTVSVEFNVAQRSVVLNAIQILDMDTIIAANHNSFTEKFIFENADIPHFQKVGCQEHMLSHLFTMRI